MFNFSYLYDIEKSPDQTQRMFSKQLLNFVLKHVVLSDKTANFVEKSSFRHKNENAYDQIHSSCDFINT